MWLGFPSVCLFVFEVVKYKWKISGILSNNTVDMRSHPSDFFFFFFSCTQGCSGKGRVILDESPVYRRVTCTNNRSHSHSKPIWSCRPHKCALLWEEARVHEGNIRRHREKTHIAKPGTSQPACREVTVQPDLRFPRHLLCSGDRYSLI